MSAWLEGLKQRAQQALQDGRDFVHKELDALKKAADERMTPEMKERLAKAKEALAEKLDAARKTLDQLKEQVANRAGQAKEDAQRFLDQARGNLDSLKKQMEQFGQQEGAEN